MNDVHVSQKLLLCDMTLHIYCFFLECKSLVLQLFPKPSVGPCTNIFQMPMSLWVSILNPTRIKYLKFPEVLKMLCNENCNVESKVCSKKSKTY